MVMDVGVDVRSNLGILEYLSSPDDKRDVRYKKGVPSVAQE